MVVSALYVMPLHHAFYRLYLTVHHQSDALVQEVDWSQKLQSLFRFIHQTISVLANKADASSEICLRLHLLAAQVCGESGQEFEELTYEFFVQAFSVYEESIPESRAQLHAITIIIGTLHGAKVFGVDNYDTLITKAALHSAKLLKKPHQATAVLLASHLWWQNEWPEVNPKSSGATEADVRNVSCFTTFQV